MQNSMHCRLGWCRQVSLQTASPKLHLHRFQRQEPLRDHHPAGHHHSWHTHHHQPQFHRPPGVQCDHTFCLLCHMATMLYSWKSPDPRRRMADVTFFMVSWLPSSALDSMMTRFLSSAPSLLPLSTMYACSSLGSTFFASSSVQVTSQRDR